MKRPWRTVDLTGQRFGPDSLTLAPELVSGSLYYHQAENLWQMDTASTVISSFSADQQMWVMK